MAIDLQKLEQKFNALFEDENAVADFEKWLEARRSSQNCSKPIVNCSSCHAPNSIRNNKVEIDIGDEQGSVASVQFEYCEKCGWRGDVEWFD